MATHVGINPGYGWCAIYNEGNKKTGKIFVGKIGPNDIYKVDEMFKEIKAKISGEIGYTCIYLWWNYPNNIRKLFIESGKLNGFLKIQIETGNTIDYTEYSFHAKCKPNPNDLIWIFTYDDFCTIWEKTNAKAKILDAFTTNPISTEDDLLEVKSLSRNDRNPNIIINNKHYNRDLNGGTVEKAFPNCKLLVYEEVTSSSESALIKARIMANDSEVLEYDTDIQLHWDMTVKINDRDFMIFKWGEFLPQEKSAVIQIQSGEKLLKVFAHSQTGEGNLEYFSEEIKVTLEMLMSGEILFTFKIDENFICTIKFEIKESKIIKDLKELYSTSFQKEFNIPQKILLNISNINAIGIDMGTSRCCAAVNRRNGIETVVLDNTGERQLPSYVSFKEKKEKCGQIVVDQLQHHAKSTIFDSKRIIGRKYRDIKLDISWPFRVMNVNDKPALKTQRCDTEFLTSAEEVAAVLLKHIKQKVEEFQGRILDDVVITVPTAFTAEQKLSTHIAAMFAGWKEIHLIPEPVAASIAYFVGRPIPNNFTMLLFDFGGGTLDVCIFKIANNSMEVISHTGHNNLGGRDIDNALFIHFLLILNRQYNINVNSKERLKYRLMQKCIKVKHALSIEKETIFDINDFDGNIEDTLVITRAEFEKLATELLGKIRNLYTIPTKILIDSLDINAIGIDLGTSSCCVAVNHRKEIETIALEDTGEKLLPSYVSFREKKEKCGQIVVDQFQHHAKSTIFDSKRIIGRKYEDVKTDASWPFGLVNFNNKPMFKVNQNNKSVLKKPEEVAAALLKHIKLKVEEFQGKELYEVVITVPAAFTENQKFATHMAAFQAGWQNVLLLPEPIAAFIAHFIDRPIPNEFKMLIIDFGGGTLDVCVVQIANNILRIVSQNGDNNIGGSDFDHLLFNHFSETLENQFGIGVNANKKLKYRLMQKSIYIKHVLSIEKETILDVNDFDTNNLNDTIKITRQEFEQIAYKLLIKTREVIKDAISKTNLISNDIHKVLFAGGSCRMPMIKTLLQEMFTNGEHCCEENPDEVVAIGAAYYAYYLQQQEKNVKSNDNK